MPMRNHSEPMDVFIIGDADRHPLCKVLTIQVQETENGEGMCSVNKSETFHSEPTDDFMNGEVDKYPLT